MDTNVIIALIVVIFIMSVALYGTWWWKQDTIVLTAVSATYTPAVPATTLAVAVPASYTFVGTLPALKTGQTAPTIADVTGWSSKTLRISITALKGVVSGAIATAALGADGKTVTFTMATAFSITPTPTGAIATATGDILRVYMKY